MKEKHKYNIDYIKSQCIGDAYELRGVQTVLLEMLCNFDALCRENGYAYYLAGGTLLGAVRHNGFIPWDDDIDVIMPRADYEKFIKFPKLNDSLEVVTYNDSKGYYHPYPYGNITDTNTIMVEHNARYLTGKGQFLDVFPLDEVPDDSTEREKYYERLKRLKYLKGLQNNQFKKCTTPKNVAFNCGVAISMLFDEMKLCRKIDEMAKMFAETDSNTLATVFVGNTYKQTWPKSIFDSAVEVDFEGHKFFAPRDYDRFLTIQYGDYMKLPPVEERVCHHGVELYRRKK